MDIPVVLKKRHLQIKQILLLGCEHVGVVTVENDREPSNVDIRGVGHLETAEGADYKGLNTAGGRSVLGRKIDRIKLLNCYCSLSVEVCVKKKISNLFSHTLLTFTILTIKCNLWFLPCLTQTIVVYAPFTQWLHRGWSSSPCNLMQSGWVFSMDGWRTVVFLRYVSSRVLSLTPTPLVQGCQWLVVCFLHSIDDRPRGLLSILSLSMTSGLDRLVDTVFTSYNKHSSIFFPTLSFLILLIKSSTEVPRFHRSVNVTTSKTVQKYQGGPVHHHREDIRGTQIFDKLLGQCHHQHSLTVTQTWVF